MAEPPTYQELIATNRQLLAENEQFREENAKLSILVKSTPEAGEETKKIEVDSGNKVSKSVSPEKK